jgi:hypothetical protein
MRAFSVCTFLVGLLTAGCFGTEIPPQKPTENPLDSAPPPKATAAPRPDDQPDDRKSATYDKAQTTAVINRATRQVAECPKINTEGPFGEVKVQLTLSGKGKISEARLPAPFEGTPIGKCIKKAFEAEIIPPWSGPDAQIEAPVTLKAPPAPPPVDDGKKKK